MANLPPVVHLDLRISPRIFENIQNDPNEILWGWGETDSLKNPEAKNLVTLSLKAFHFQLAGVCGRVSSLIAFSSVKLWGKKREKGGESLLTL